MLCPFCQHDLDETKMSCAKCGAEFPTPGYAVIAARWRSLLLSGGLLVIASLILVDCVINHMPGGRDSGYYAPGSPQVSMQPTPNTKDAAVQALMNSWAQGHQPSQNDMPANRYTH